MGLCGPGHRSPVSVSRTSPHRAPFPGQREPLPGEGVLGWAITTVGLRPLAGGEGDTSH